MARIMGQKSASPAGSVMIRTLKLLITVNNISFDFKTNVLACHLLPKAC